MRITQQLLNQVLAKIAMFPGYVFTINQVFPEIFGDSSDPDKIIPPQPDKMVHIFEIFRVLENGGYMDKLIDLEGQYPGYGVTCYGYKQIEELPTGSSGNAGYPCTQDTVPSEENTPIEQTPQPKQSTPPAHIEANEGKPATEDTQAGVYPGLAHGTIKEGDVLRDAISDAWLKVIKKNHNNGRSFLDLEQITEGESGTYLASMDFRFTSPGDRYIEDSSKERYLYQSDQHLFNMSYLSERPTPIAPTPQQTEGESTTAVSRDRDNREYFGIDSGSVFFDNEMEIHLVAKVSSPRERGELELIEVTEEILKKWREEGWKEGELVSKAERTITPGLLYEWITKGVGNGQKYRYYGGGKLVALTKLERPTGIEQ